MYRRCVVAVGGDSGSPGDVDSGDVEWARGECKEESAAVVGPLAVVVVVIVRGDECVTEAAVVLECVACEEVTWEVCLPCCWSTECARKADRKEERKVGWFEGISPFVCLLACSAPPVGVVDPLFIVITPAPTRGISQDLGVLASRAFRRSKSLLLSDQVSCADVVSITVRRGVLQAPVLVVWTSTSSGYAIEAGYSLWLAAASSSCNYSNQGLIQE
jgi:hypothetical protein